MNQLPTSQLIRLLVVLFCAALLLLTAREIRLAFSYNITSAQTEPCEPNPSPTPSTTPTPSPTPTSTPTTYNPSDIFLTEFMACPSSGNEWLELYNAGDTDIQVTNWQVKDQVNNTKLISGTIPAGQFTAFEWTGALLNNTGDTFTVYTDTGEEIGSASYNQCDTGISFVYDDGEWIGALDTPNEDTEISENTLNTATKAASLITSNNNNQKEPNSPQATTSAILATTTNSHFELPNLPLPNLNLPSPPPVTTTPTSEELSTKPPLAPALSVIIGGLGQLCSSSLALYANYRSTTT